MLKHILSTLVLFQHNSDWHCSRQVGMSVLYPAQILGIQWLSSSEGETFPFTLGKATVVTKLILRSAPPQSTIQSEKTGTAPGYLVTGLGLRIDAGS